MLDAARQLAVADATELFETVSRQLDALLPELLTAAFPDTEFAALPAIQASARNAPEDEELAAISDGYAATAATLAALAATTPEPPLPPEPLRDRIERQLGKVDEFTKFAADAEARLARVWRLKTVQGAVRGGQWVAGTKAFAALQDSLVQQGLPGLASDARAIMGAVVSGLLLRWYYARRRRLNDNLPGIPEIGPPDPSSS